MITRFFISILFLNGIERLVLISKFSVRKSNSLKCYRQRTKTLSVTNYGRVMECPKNVTHCVTGIGTTGKRNTEHTEFEMLGRTCLSPEKVKTFCDPTRNCQYMMNKNGLMFRLCYFCCTSDLCNMKVPNKDKLTQGEYDF